MDIRELFEEFIQYKRTKLKESSIKNYIARLEVFLDFIKPQINMSGEVILRGFDKNSMKKAVKDYVIKRNLKYRTSAMLYVSVINEFFTFLIENGKIDNSMFSDRAKIKKLNKDIKHFINNEMGLKPCKGVEPLEEVQVNELIRMCNQAIHISTDEIESFDATYNDGYDDYISAIAIKLTLFTGVKLENLYKMKKHDFDVINNTMQLNGYVLNLPRDLSNDMKKMFELQQRIIPTYTEESYLFLDRDGNHIENGGALFKLLDDLIGSQSSAKVNSYALIQMIQEGINVGMIVKLTGCSYNTYDCCQEIVNSQYTQGERDRYISAKLRGMELFYNL